MNPVTNSLIRRITLVAALSLAACEKNDSRKAHAEQAELPSSSESNVVIDLDLSNPNQEIIEFEGFVGHGSPVEVQPRENLGALPEDVIITESRTEMPEFRTQPDKFKEEAEQASAGQPATRPVVKPEGGVQPQPESEGRSR